jgi:hypothetical protein
VQSVQCQGGFQRLQEVLRYIDEARQHERDERNKALDEFDGLSPAEINALAAGKSAMA